MKLNPEQKHFFFEADDDVKLHYVQSGAPIESQKRVILFLPGWSQSIEQFDSQIKAFADSLTTVLALDPRGHGLSSKPSTGYRLSRIAKDLDNFLNAVVPPSSTVNIVAHSASCAVVWNYVELFGQSRLQSLVLVDQMLCALKDSSWSEKECKQYGAIVTPAEGKACAEKIAQDNTGEFTHEFMKSMFSDSLSSDALEHLVEESLRMPRSAAAQFIWSVKSSDNRDVIETIQVPTLCIGADDSKIPVENIEYMARMIPAPTSVVVLSGSHFMFYEEPEPFNEVVSHFLQQQSTSASGTDVESIENRCR